MSWPNVPESPDPVSVDEWVRAWETAVRVYGQAQSRADRASIWDVSAAEAMAAASADLARTWRGLLAARPVPHWVSSAVETAADVFEEQTDAWRTRESSVRQALQQEIAE